MADRTLHQERLSAVFNFRDLGGLPAADGGTIRSGVLFRSDSFHEAPAEDVAYLADEVGIRRVLDLRSESEVEADSAGGLARSARAPATRSRRRRADSGWRRATGSTSTTSPTAWSGCCGRSRTHTASPR